MATDRILRTLSILCAVMFHIAPGKVSAQTYPNKPIRFIVTQAAGGTSDVIARAFAQKLSEFLGQQVVVDNRPGANGIIGAEVVLKSPPDGYTLLFGSSPILAINPALYKKLPYDPVSDFSHIAMMGKAFYAVLAPLGSNVKSIGDFIQSAKTKPFQLNYGSGSSGARANIEMFLAAAGIKVTHVPYKSNTQALSDLLANRLDLLFEATVTAAPHIKSGKVKALAVTSTRRLPQFPDLPTVSESGVPGYEYTAWVSLAAPAGLPKDVQKRLSEETEKVIGSPEIVERFRGMGFEPEYLNGDQTLKLLRSDIDNYKKAVRDAGIHQE
ncbi:MAG: hypothetical protein IOMNBAOH_00941 [Rhodocyclaceae bacterium]|nr:hypothetical protein [Rhodocyclaceae bacterium]